MPMNTPLLWRRWLKLINNSESYSIRTNTHKTENQIPSIVSSLDWKGSISTSATRRSASESGFGRQAAQPTFGCQRRTHGARSFHSSPKQHHPLEQHRKIIQLCQRYRRNKVYISSQLNKLTDVCCFLIFLSSLVYGSKPILLFCSFD